MLAHVLRGCIPSTIFIVYRSVVPLNKEALKMSLFPTKMRVIGWFRTLEVDVWWPDCLDCHTRNIPRAGKVATWAPCSMECLSTPVLL